MGGTGDDQTNSHILRSARNSFLDHILKRPNLKPPSINYDDTTAEPLSSEPITLSNKRMKLFTRRTSEGVDAEPSNRTPLIIRFYDPAVKANDFQGRTLENILGWRDQILERSHNYIQILFPLPEGSPFNYEAPIITREVFDAFHARAELRNELRKSLIRMLTFYGFELVDESSVQKQIEAEDRIENGQLAEIDQAEQLTKTETADTAIDAPTSGAEQTEAATPGSSENQHPDISAGEMSGLTSSDTRPSEQTGQTDATPEVLTNAQPDEEHVKTEDNSRAIKVKEENEAEEKAPDAIQQGRNTVEPPPQPPSEKLPGLLGGIVIVRADHWQNAFRNWAVRFDHNHLRITRILRCLRVLGLEEEAEAFYSALKEVFNDPAIHINERSMLYWRKAVRAPLHVAPDGERIAWLKRWQDEQEEAQQNVDDAHD